MRRELGKVCCNCLQFNSSKVEMGKEQEKILRHLLYKSSISSSVKRSFDEWKILP